MLRHGEHLVLVKLNFNCLKNLHALYTIRTR